MRKGKMFIFIAFLVLSFTTIIMPRTAMATEGQEIDLNLSTGNVVAINADGEKVIANGSVPFEIYTSYKIEVGMPVSEIMLMASSNLTERGFDVATNIRITYDDYCKETIQTTISKNGTWYKLQIGEGRSVRSIEVQNGSSGNVTTVNKIMVKEGKPAYTLADSTPKLEAPIGEPSIIDGSILQMNWNLPRAFYPVNKLVSSVTITGNNQSDGSGTESSNWSPAFNAQLKFYIDDNNYMQADLPFTRFVQTIKVPVPKEYEGKVITKIEVVGNSIQKVRRIDIEAMELFVKSIKVEPSTITLTGPNATKLKVTATMSNGAIKDITSDPDTEYDIDDEDVATVATNGIVKLGNGAVHGDTATIEIHNGEAEAVCNVKVVLVSTKSIKSSISSVVLSSVQGKNTKQLKITATNTDKKQINVTNKAIYASSNPKFTVTKTGMLKVTPGTAKRTTGVITVTFEGKTCKISVKVK
jgi:hypothetical protein